MAKPSLWHRLLVTGLMGVRRAQFWGRGGPFTVRSLVQGAFRPPNTLQNVSLISDGELLSADEVSGPSFAGL